GASGVGMEADQPVQEAANASPHSGQWRQSAPSRHLRKFLIFILGGHEWNPFSLFWHFPEENRSICSSGGERPAAFAGRLRREGDAGHRPGVPLAVADLDTAL